MSMDTNHGNDFNKNTTDRNMNDKSVTAFLLSPRYRIYRHLLLQLVVVLITINVLWYEPLQTVSFGRRLGGCLAYFASMNMVIYINLYVLVPYFLLKNRWGSYVLMAVITNIAVITFLSVTQGLLFEVILPGKIPMALPLLSMLFGHTDHRLCHGRLCGYFIVHALATLQPAY